MWNISRVKFENLFSHPETEIQVKTNGLTLIVGENLDDEGNNGAGKTTIIEAIAIALTNKSLRDLNKTSFINRDAEECTVELELVNNVLNSTLLISRTFYRKNKPVKITIVENGELNTDVTSVDEANKRIYELIGVSREDLLRYYIISQDNRYTFFTAGDVEKKEVLNRITSANMINPILDRLSSDIKSVSSTCSDHKNNVISLESKKSVLEEQLQELLNNDGVDSEIKELEESIERIKNRKQERLDKIDEYKTEMSSVSNELKKLVIPNTDELSKEKNLLKSKISEGEQTIYENKKVIRTAELDLSSKVTCPNCKEEFIQDSQLGLTIDELNTLIDSAKQENNALQKDISEYKKRVDELIDKIDESEKIMRQQQKLNTRYRMLGDLIEEETRASWSDDRKINDYLLDVHELNEKRNNNDRVLNLKGKIDDVNKSLVLAKKEVTQTEQELDLLNYWNYYMGKAGFMTYVANKAISVLEGTVNSFLKKFKSSLSVNINGFKVLKDGNVRDKIDVFVLQNGWNAEEFMSKSGGERGRISLAGVLSIQHLINMSCGGKGLNLLCLDETFHGVDSVGQERVIRILEQMGITILMITQNVSSEFNSNNRIVVKKRNGESFVE